MFTVSLALGTSGVVCHNCCIKPSSTFFAACILGDVFASSLWAQVPSTPVALPEAATRWSSATKGLQGRVIVEFEDKKPGLREAVNLELRNVSEEVISITSWPQIKTELFDTQGKAVPHSGGGVVGGAIRDEQSIVIAPDVYVGFRVDARTMGVPFKDAVLLSVGGSWALKPGRYILKATVVVEQDKDTTKSRWFGEMVLPPVEFSVTKAQVKRD